MAKRLLTCKSHSKTKQQAGDKGRIFHGFVSEIMF